MSGRVLRFEGSAHREAERLLPWLVNGTLEGEERRLVERHLAECGACQRERAWLESLQQACTATEAEGDDDAAQAWQRLRRRIAQERRPIARTRTRGWGGRSAMLWRLAVAVQAVVILALGTLLVRAPMPAPAAYRTLSAAPVPSVQLAVVFDPRISEAQLRSLVRASQARIVDGPTDTGAYVLSVPRARAATVSEALRAAPGVTLVESLSGGER